MWYNERKRKPILRIRILQTLALRGKHTKKTMEKFLKEGTKEQEKNSHYSEISDAYDILFRNGLIERRNSSVPKEKPYALTKLGLRELIYRTEDIDDCWEYVLGFDLHYDEVSEPGNLADIIYNILMKRFMKFKSIGDYSYLLKAFNGMSTVLWQRLDKNDIHSILSVLSDANKEMTADEIATRTSKNQKMVETILTELSMDCSDYTSIYDLEEVDFENERLRFMDFLQHLLINYYLKKGKKCYEISLFGIILLLKILRNHKNYPTNRVNDFETKLQRIAANYANKVPLIFGKWSLLSNCLGLLSIYNFEPILVEGSQMEFDYPLEVPLVSDGNKELFGSLFPMHILNQEIRRKILDNGIKIILRFIAKPEQFIAKFNATMKYDRFSVHNYLKNVKIYLNFLLNYVNKDTYEVFKEIRSFHKDTKVIINSGTVPSVKIFEKAFTDELTISYYINLMNSFYNIQLFPHGDLRSEVILSGFNIGEEYRAKGMHLFTPRDYLTYFLSKDGETKNFISELMKDVIKYQELLSGKITALNNSLICNKIRA